MKPARVLVPVDFSQPSTCAVETAADFARQYGGSITLLHVLEVPARPKLATHLSVATLGILIEELRSKLDALGRKQIASEHYKSALVHQGKPFEEILKVAGALKADLIIMATHGYTGLKRVFLGSTAERVIRYAPCSVLTVQLGQKSNWPRRCRAL